MKAIRDQQEEWLTKEVGSRLGDPNLRMLDDASVLPLRRAVGDEFDRLMQRGADPFDLALHLTADDARRMRATFDNLPDVPQSPSFRPARDDLLALLDNPAKPIEGPTFASVPNMLK